MGLTTIVAAWANREAIELRIRSVNVNVSPKPAPPNSFAPATPPPLRIVAPWILSALPGCFAQISDTTGPPPYVRAHLPAGSTQVAPSTRLAYGDCVILVRREDAFVWRGNDRFYIPPHVRFYTAGASVALLRDDGVGMDLRVYQPAPH